MSLSSRSTEIIFHTGVGEARRQAIKPVSSKCSCSVNQRSSPSKFKYQVQVFLMTHLYLGLYSYYVASCLLASSFSPVQKTSDVILTAWCATQPECFEFKMADTTTTEVFEDSTVDSSNLPQAKGISIEQEEPKADVARAKTEHAEDAKGDQNEVFVEGDMNNAEEEKQQVEESKDDDNTGDKGKCDGPLGRT